MLKIVAGLAQIVLCLILMFTEPSFSQTPQMGTPAPAPVSPPQQSTPQAVPSPNAAPSPAPQQSPSSQLDAQPNTAAPGQPADTTQQNAPLHQDTSPGQVAPTRHGKVVSRKHHQAKPRRNEAEGGEVGTSYVTAWSGPYVIERAHRYDAFVVEGRWYRARSFCPGWEAGERVSLRAGPPGWCALVNRTRHRTCLVSCDGRAGWYPYL
jgi:hypothetical protein